MRVYLPICDDQKIIEETQEVTASLAAATGTSKDAAVVVAFFVYTWTLSLRCII